MPDAKIRRRYRRRRAYLNRTGKRMSPRLMEGTRDRLRSAIPDIVKETLIEIAQNEKRTVSSVAEEVFIRYFELPIQYRKKKA